MKKITLEEFAGSMGQVKAAEMLGVRQSAVSKALRLKRKVFVLVLDDGSVQAEEIKPFPAPKQVAANAL